MTNLRTIVRTFGIASEVVELEQAGLSELGARQIRLRMLARAINPSDLITISGAYRSRTSLPFLPGFEGVGVVEAIGAELERIDIGSRVLPIGSAGTWQAFKDTEPAWCLPVPGSMSDLDAATSYVNPMTAWLMLHEKLKIRPGIRLLINAAGSSIGQILIRMANAHGISPIAIVRARASADRLSGLGLEDLLYENAESYAAHMADLRARGGVDAVLDCIGGPRALITAWALKPGGDFVHYGLLSGEPIPPEFRAARPDIAFTIFHLRQWVHGATYETVRRIFGIVSGLVESGLAASAISATYPLTDVHKALIAAQAYRGGGKIILSGPD